ncbi:hypothetical protein [Spirochaeta isovalerica]|uniref:Lipoprotein n=1 Tax=Spirochaeta isovalerica TaxID=150 RepID=A0A841RBL7_9SPIO|nr:hypothetical protein [Spirochaeta isovalerica]MBB6481365.1 hypothetical protein [Spirochaeta isovalerica]
MKYIPVLAVLISLSSCVLTGSGIRDISGKLFGTVPASVKVGFFPPGNDYAFTYDKTEDDSTGGADKDMVFTNATGHEKDGSTGVHVFTPVAGLIATPSGGEFSLTLPDDPTTITCLIAWDDANDDDQFDLGSEDAYLPVIELEGKNHVVHHFSYIEVVENITYEAVYSTMDRDDVYYDLDFYEPRQDGFDVIGADGFNFYFD